MQSRAALERRIADLLSEELHVEAAPGVDLVATGALDSLSFVNLLVQLERKLDVRFAMHELDLDQFRTVEGIAELVAKQKGAAASPREDDGSRPRVREA